MDLVAEEDREAILEDRKRLIEESCLSCGVENFQCFGTSIWDETLYKAWSEIVTNLIPNIRLLETHLQKFCRICDADEVVLFERATFLVISHAQGNTEDDNNNNNGTTTTHKAVSSLPDQIAAAGDGGDTVDGTGSDMITPSVDAATATSSLKDNNNLPPTEIPTNGSAAMVVGTTSGGGGGGGGNTMTTTMTMTTPRHVSRCLFFDDHRFEKISNIIKQFKLSCGKAQSQFQGMQVQNSRFTAYIDQFTANTFILVIVSNPMVKSAATMWNIQNARDHFERFIPRI
jgi:hypothetical protein